MAFYKDGVISIPNVTGDVVITASAISQGPSYHNLLQQVGYVNGKRVSLSSGNFSDASGSVVLGTIEGGIPCTAGDIVRVKGLTYPPAGGSNNCGIGAYKANNVWQGTSGGYATYLRGTGDQTNKFKYTIGGDLLTINISSGATDVVGIRLNGLGTTGADIIITKNEEIPA